MTYAPADIAAATLARCCRARCYSALRRALMLLLRFHTISLLRFFIYASRRHAADSYAYYAMSFITVHTP